MRSIFFCFLLAPLLLNGQNTIQLASDVWPPFTNDFGESAFAQMLVHEALGRSNVQASTQIVDFEAVLAGLENGTFDGSAALWKTAEREDYLLYSEPYLENRLILVGRKGSNVQVMELRQLKDVSIAVVGSYAYGDAIARIQGVQFVPTASDQESLDKLLAGEVDYMLADELLVKYVQQHQSDEVKANLAVGGNAMFRKTLHFAVRKDYPNAEKIVLQFNDKIREMVLDGTYNRILEINWVEADVDGDGITELVLGGENAGIVQPTAQYSIMAGSGPKTKQAERYYIDGKVYSGWDNVPDRYKVKSTTSANTHHGVGPTLNFGG